MSWKNFTEMRYYFYDLAQSLPGLKSFSLAIDARLNSSQRSDFRYPLLELEVPEITFKAIEGGDQQKIYACRLSVLTEVQEDDWSGQEDALSSMEDLIGEVLTRLHHDGIFESESIPCYPVQNAMHDNLYGWGIQFDFYTHQSLCYTPADWQQVYRLIPVFVSEAQALAVNVEGQDFSTNWSSEAGKKAALNALATQIDAVAGVSAHVDAGSLVIAGDVAGAAVSVTPSTDEHTWIIFNQQ
jgi:hypothetical protein